MPTALYVYSNDSSALGKKHVFYPYEELPFITFYQENNILVICIQKTKE
jgi:hypothetical protein